MSTETETDQLLRLSQKLGISFEKEQEVNIVDATFEAEDEYFPKREGNNKGTEIESLPSVPNTAVAVASSTANRIDDEEEDYKLTRKNYTNIADMGNKAIEDLHQIARLTNEPRAFEALATLIKALNDTNKNLYSIHEEARKAKQLAQNPLSNLPAGTQLTQIDKAVFVGSQNDLLHKVKYEKDVNTDSNTEPKSVTTG